MPYCDECGNYTSWIYPVGYGKGNIVNMCKDCFNKHYRDKIDKDIERYEGVPTINEDGEIGEND